MEIVATLGSDETQALIGTSRGASNALYQPIVNALLRILDTESSLFVSGLKEGNINALRTRMQRGGYRLKAVKATRNGTIGHVLMATTA